MLCARVGRMENMMCAKEVKLGYNPSDQRATAYNLSHFFSAGPLLFTCRLDL